MVCSCIIIIFFSLKLEMSYYNALKGIANDTSAKRPHMQWWIQDLPEGGAPTPKQIFCQKLHENERIWTLGGTCTWCPLRMANDMCDLFVLRPSCDPLYSSSHAPTLSPCPSPWPSYALSYVLSLCNSAVIYSVFIYSAIFFVNLVLAHMKKRDTCIMQLLWDFWPPEHSI